MISCVSHYDLNPNSTDASRAQPETHAPQRVNNASHALQLYDTEVPSYETGIGCTEERAIIQVVDNGHEEFQQGSQVELDATQYGCPEDNCRCEECNALEEFDLFRALSMDRRNLILDSEDPDIAPHIVVTPPPFHPYDYYVVAYNQVYPQYSHRLVVPPPIGIWEGKASMHPLRGDMSTREVQDPNLSLAQDISDDEPERVFSRSKFERQIFSSLESLDSLRSVHREQCKQIAQLAARRATKLLATPSPVLQTLLTHDDFTWTDPGAALLAELSQYRGTTIITAREPFTAPHIVITEPPPPSEYDKRVLDHNTAPKQIWEDGNKLCVPEWYYGPGDYSYYYDYAQVNQPQQWWDTQTWPEAAWAQSDDSEDGAASEANRDQHSEVFYYHQDMGSEQSSDGEYSRPETPMPSTPSDDTFGHAKFLPSLFTGPVIGVDSVDGSFSFCQEADSPVMFSPSSAQSLCGMMASGPRPVYVFGDFSGLDDLDEPVDEQDKNVARSFCDDGNVDSPIDDEKEETAREDPVSAYQDDDEDDLPPFDDWYTSIASRTLGSSAIVVV